MEERYTKCINEALAWIQANHAPQAIFVCGSIMRGAGNANSDFDIYVIHHKDFRQRIQKYFNGVPCEIFLNSVKHTHNSFEIELENNRPCTAHMLATGLLYFDDKSVDTQALVAMAQKYVSLSLGLTAQQITSAKYSIALTFEDATDVLDVDALTVQMLLHKVVAEVIPYLFALHKTPLPGLKHRIANLADIDAQAADLIGQFYAANTANKQYELTGLLLEHLDISKTFFEWTSDKAEQ